MQATGKKEEILLDLIYSSQHTKYHAILNRKKMNDEQKI